jgi:hypothetical protein
VVKDLLWDLSEGSKDQGSFLEVEDRSGGLEVAGYQCRLLRVVFRRF